MLIRLFVVYFLLVAFIGAVLNYFIKDIYACRNISLVITALIFIFVWGLSYDS